MEYNKIIELARQSAPDAPGTDEVLNPIHHRLRVRRQRQSVLATLACLLLAASPLALLYHGNTPSTTLAEAVSATIQTAPDDLPAPLAGYQNSIRNHKTMMLLLNFP